MGNIVNLSHLLEFYLGGAGVRLYRVPNNWCSQLGDTTTLVWELFCLEFAENNLHLFIFDTNRIFQPLMWSDQLTMME